MKNIKMANKGVVFEEEAKISNKLYREKKIALIQKISTPWKVIRIGPKISHAFPEGKSTLDFRGTVAPGISISFDCKEVEKEDRGLPLSYIKDHQLEYIREALEVGEKSFILCYMKLLNKRFFINGYDILKYYELWQENKGKRGYNFIPVDVMQEIKSRNGIVLDYLEVLKNE